jgi:hypothetical protein
VDGRLAAHNGFALPPDLDLEDEEGREEGREEEEEGGSSSSR